MKGDHNMAIKNTNSTFTVYGKQNGRMVSHTISGKPGMTDSQMSSLVRQQAKNMGMTGVSGSVKNTYRNK